MAHLVLNKMGKAFLDDDTAVREQKPATKKIQIIKEVEKSLNMQVTPLFFRSQPLCVFRLFLILSLCLS